MEWISVKDRLPNNFDPVAILVNGKTKSVGVHVIDWHFYTKFSFPMLVKQLIHENIVTNWMPLPEPAATS